MSLEIAGIASNSTPQEFISKKSAEQHRKIERSEMEQQRERQHDYRKTAARSADRIEEFADELMRITQVFNKRLKFTINRELDQLVVKVIDGNTDEIIKELPPEELQKLHIRIREAIGILIDEEI